MKKQLSQVREFQLAFKGAYNTQPTLLEFEDYNLRYKLTKEENEEYLEACEKKDIVGIADALGDKLYVVLGDILSHGLQYKIEEVFDEIHKSNMSKLDANGQPIINGVNGHDESKPLGKVLKSKNYFKPNIKGILEK